MVTQVAIIAIGTQITLCETEVRISKHIARERNSIARKGGVTNAKLGTISDEQMDLEGAASEMAFCKLFNAFPDFSIYVRSSKAGGDQNGDCTLSNGYTVDVKTTTRENGRLLAPRWKKPGVTLYALMVGTCPTYTFKGFARGTELLQESNLLDLGRGPGYALEQKSLKSLDDIIG